MAYILFSSIIALVALAAALVPVIVILLRPTEGEVSPLAPASRPAGAAGLLVAA